MAKESMKARERKRQRIVAKYAAKRKSLKEANDYKGIPAKGFRTRSKKKSSSKFIIERRKK